jgi:hypothetical protein
MRARVLRPLMFGAFLLCAAAHAQRGAPAAELPSWLTGQWVHQRGETLWEEHWSEPAGGAMMGMTRMVRGDEPVLYEFQTIETTGDGEIVLLLRHFNAPGMELWEGEKDAPMRFTLVSTRSERDRAEGVLQEAAVFERTTRGGPQRVIYHLTADGVCEMRVALLPEGAQVWETEVAFRFKRVSASR